MEIGTQTEVGFLVHHFCGGTPLKGEWEYRPSPIGLAQKTPRMWESVGSGKERVGKGSQTIKRGKRKDKGIQTMDVGEEEKRKWEEERRTMEERVATLKATTWKLIEVELGEIKSNRDRYREWIIRNNMRKRNEKDEEMRETLEILQRWVEDKERECEAKEVLGGMLDQIEINEMIEHLTPPALLAPFDEEIDTEEAGLLEELLTEIRKENTPPAARPRPKIKILSDVIFKKPLYPAPRRYKRRPLKTVS